MGRDSHEADTVDLDFLRQSAREFLAERGERSSVSDLAELDWTGLLVDEDLGGSGWLVGECCVIAEELGRVRNPSGWFGSVLCAAAVAGAPVDLRDRWLPPLLTGAATGAFALAERTVRVIDGDAVSVLVLADENGLRLVDASEVTMRRPDVDSQDTTRRSWCLDVAGAPAVVIGDGARAAELISVARLLVSADAIGCLSMALERLVEYLRGRVAFGAPIASFQAVQHRLVELLVFELKAKAIVAKAARALAAGEPASELAAAAHAFVAAHATHAVDECMQLSGGIGFTWEYPLHHELRRASADAWLFGTARSSRAAMAGARGW